MGFRVTHFVAAAVLAVWVEVRLRLGLNATRVCSIFVLKRFTLRLSSSGSLGLSPCICMCLCIGTCICMCRYLQMPRTASYAFTPKSGK